MSELKAVVQRVVEDGYKTVGGMDDGWGYPVTKGELGNHDDACVYVEVVREDKSAIERVEDWWDSKQKPVRLRVVERTTGKIDPDKDFTINTKVFKQGEVGKMDSWVRNEFQKAAS